MAAGVAVTWATAPAGSGTEKSGRDGVAAIAPPASKAPRIARVRRRRTPALIGEPGGDRRGEAFDALDAASGSAARVCLTPGMSARPFDQLLGGNTVVILDGGL